MRASLSKLAPKQRVSEWARLRAAAAYRDDLPEAEIHVTGLQRDIRRNSKKAYLQTLGARYMKITKVRREMLGYPQRVSAEPSNRVDYSRRLAALATRVTTQTPTNGKWPLHYEKKT